ncbi:MAG: hypothetical protein ABFD50_03315, partial [Smithella sp.]
ILDVIFIVFTVIAEFLKRRPIKTSAQIIKEKFDARKRERQANLRAGSESRLSSIARDDIDTVTRMREADNIAKLKDD